ncbi:hypothetical protein [Holophaga foetida]|uniref:hypothetical protein n=1 Tax=Holophaga foetida TaxID=35839 RepID=UPI0002472ED5|nr:hypothetical protein [Holophaga foetida]
MSSATPLVFRPSAAQRAIAVLLCAGSLMIGIRAMLLLVQGLPRLLWTIRVAEASQEATLGLWIIMGVSIGACLAAGALLLLAIMGLMLIEGCHVLVDELGIVVDFDSLPGPLARKLGAGRLTWKQVKDVEKHRFFFVITGDQEGPMRQVHLRFLMVDELERLMTLIFERSPNLHHPG